METVVDLAGIVEVTGMVEVAGMVEVEDGAIEMEVGTIIEEILIKEEILETGSALEIIKKREGRMIMIEKAMVGEIEAGTMTEIRMVVRPNKNHLI